MDNTLAQDNQSFDQITTISQIGELSRVLADKLGSAVQEIQSVNNKTKLLSINARIEAARSGIHGKGFSVVAAEMNKLSDSTSQVATQLSHESRDLISKLNHISQTLSTHIRGVRLSDLCLMNIDLIDRNLYERSCDVRWWATDNSVVEALRDQTHETARHASQRLGVILDAYTVYFDLVLCDLDGKVIANGRPKLYSSVGSRHFGEEWFQSALRTANGGEFGFQTVHRSSLVNNQHVLIYSCSVRENGESRGKVLGVLGVVFNWEGLAQTVVKKCPLSAKEKDTSRICIIDDDGLVLADSKDNLLKEHLTFDTLDKLMKSPKEFSIGEYKGGIYCVAHALSPGFETYRTGWHSVIIQEIDEKQ